MQKMEKSIALKGSASRIAEFFGYALNSILYQRGVYPPETFSFVPKYGMNMMIANREDLSKYISNILVQVENWIEDDALQRVVLVITSCDTNIVLERWTFLTANRHSDSRDYVEENEGSEARTYKEIQAIIRQITASVTFLPILDEACSFEVLVYTDSVVNVPDKWEESDPLIIANSIGVKLRSFSTSMHKVEANVSYRQD